MIEFQNKFYQLNQVPHTIPIDTTYSTTPPKGLWFPITISIQPKGLLQESHIKWFPVGVLHLGLMKLEYTYVNRQWNNSKLCRKTTVASTTQFNCLTM